MKPSICYLICFIIFCFSNLILSISSIAQDNNPSFDDCPNIVDCLFMRNAARSQMFIDEGINIDIQNPSGNTLLMSIANDGYADMVTVLLNAKAKTDIKNTDGRTALMVASRNGHLDIVRLLLEAGADATIEDADGHTAFYHAFYTIRHIHPFEDIDKIDRLLKIAVLLRQKEKEG